jgi:hypothetical protein
MPQWVHTGEIGGVQRNGEKAGRLKELSCHKACHSEDSRSFTPAKLEGLGKQFKLSSETLEGYDLKIQILVLSDSTLFTGR